MIRKLTVARLAAILGVGVIVACGSVSAGGGGTSASCTSLEACCAHATGAAQLDCLQTVAGGVDSSCALELLTLDTSGSCGTTTSTSTSTATPGLTGCTALEECCGLMSGPAASSCLTLVQDGNASVCNAELSVYEGNGSCHIAGSGTGTGTSTAASACATLDACCPQLPASTAAQCLQIVQTGNAATCTSTLAQAEMAGFCNATGTGTGTGGFTGTGTNTGTGGFTGTGTGTGISTGTGTGIGTTSTSTAEITCANPPATVPSGFVPPTGIIGSGACTASQTSVLGACFQSPPTNDAGENLCDDVVGTSTTLNSCGTCVEGTDIVPGQPIPAQWGYEIVAAIYGTLGDTSTLYPVEYELNYGGCLIGASPTHTSQCGLDVMAATACELAVCLPLCAVPEANAGQADAFDALVACTQAADSHACAAYVNAENTDCVSVEADGGLADKCTNLFNLDLGVSGAAPTGTAAQQADLIGLMCGGADAGF